MTLQVELIDTHHTTVVNGIQIDLCYNFKTSSLTVFVDGVYITVARFNPSRQILNYTNVLEVSVTYYEHYSRYVKQKEKAEEKNNNESTTQDPEQQ